MSIRVIGKLMARPKWEDVVVDSVGLHSMKGIELGRNYSVVYALDGSRVVRQGESLRIMWRSIHIITIFRTYRF